MKITLDEYLKFMWEMKTKHFVTFWRQTINKMHIVYIDTPLSRTMNLFINDFINEQEVDVTFNSWICWRDAFLKHKFKTFEDCDDVHQ
jgi:predicted nuclease of restriction endonuclease-like RecB superfamily